MACARLECAAGASVLQRPRKFAAWIHGGRLSSQQASVSFCPSGWRRGSEQALATAALQDAPLRDQAEASAASLPAGPDLFLLDLAERLEESVAQGSGSHSLALDRLRERSSELVLAKRWPSSKDEAYRFTDLRFLKNSVVRPIQGTDADRVVEAELDLASFAIPEAAKSRLVFVDGVFSQQLSNLEDVPEEVYAGSVSAAPAELVEQLVLPTLGSGAGDEDVFASLNGLGARDVFLIAVPPEVKLFDVLHVLYISTGGRAGDGDGDAGPSFSLSCPRLLVAVGKGAEVEFVEEFVGVQGAPYWTNAVCDIHIEQGGNLVHRYVQTQQKGSVHVKQTSVTQAENSCYKHVEVGLGGRLSRHNLQIQQLGPDTMTEMSSFLLAGKDQLHDLHSKLVLSHPGGFSRQLHKCIVSQSSGHGVFDGNVRVNRYAQQTDAGQLSRSLLLAPRATVNVKPNLQIIADDVKCSHGAAISDFEAEQLFYFQARGIDALTARSALIFSFGAEVIERLLHPSLRKRVETQMKASLADAAVLDRTIPLGL